MILSRFRRRAERRAAIEAESDQLIGDHGGREGWQIIYARCRDMDASWDERAHAYRVRLVIEKRQHMPDRLDTSTRPLERS